MMFCTTTVLFALASVALAVEPQMLRTTSAQTQTQEEPQADSAPGIPLLIVEPKEFAPVQEDEEDNSLDIGKGTFGMKKGMKCDGGFDAKKGMMKHCEGGMEKEFSMSWTTSDVKGELSQELMKQLQDFMSEPEMLIGVSDEEMEAHLLFDDEEEEDDAPLTKTMEFGGTMKVDWGCKVTYEKSVKGISKKVECGGKYDAASGKKKDAVDGSSVLDYFN
ncbi:unnamed protein product [Cylindrotheca closterium]|uniref:Uncharacterized protein n=1 Tax=Cylindrotheca closterium TaxID=2856 RepID=A0AAD2G295_9STRA|nr:unnamed protein product [Cylindrotheca closterium]